MGTPANKYPAATFAAWPKTREQKLVSALALDGQFPDRSGVVRPGIFGQRQTMDRLNSLIAMTAGRRLTYAELIA